MHILIIDDDPLDVEFTMLALREHGLHEHVSVARDGQEAIDFLCGCHGALPTVVLLDLNMPRVSGHDVLRFIRATPVLQPLYVVILSTSDQAEDLARCHAADEYLVKPIDLERFVQRIGQATARLLETDTARRARDDCA